MQEACEVIEIRAPVHPAKPTSDRSVRNIARAGVLTRLTCGAEDNVPPDPERVRIYTVRPAYGYSGNSRLPPRFTRLTACTAIRWEELGSLNLRFVWTPELEKGYIVETVAEHAARAANYYASLLESRKGVEWAPAHDKAREDEQDIVLSWRRICGPFCLPFEPSLRASFIPSPERCWTTSQFRASFGTGEFIPNRNRKRN
jgi:hypothetical protein